MSWVNFYDPRRRFGIANIATRRLHHEVIISENFYSIKFTQRVQTSHRNAPFTRKIRVSHRAATFFPTKNFWMRREMKTKNKKSTPHSLVRRIIVNKHLKNCIPRNVINKQVDCEPWFGREAKLDNRRRQSEPNEWLHSAKNKHKAGEKCAPVQR